MRGGGVVNRKETCNKFRLHAGLKSSPLVCPLLFLPSRVQNVRLTLMVKDMALKNHVRVEVVPFLVLFLAWICWGKSLSLVGICLQCLTVTNHFFFLTKQQTKQTNKKNLKSQVFACSGVIQNLIILFCFMLFLFNNTFYLGLVVLVLK